MKVCECQMMVDVEGLFAAEMGWEEVPGIEVGIPSFSSPLSSMPSFQINQFISLIEGSTATPSLPPCNVAAAAAVATAEEPFPLLSKRWRGQSKFGTKHYRAGGPSSTDVERVSL